MQRPLVVYLAGPISGRKFKDAMSWRSEFTALFDKYPGKFEVRNPMRGNELLSHQRKVLDGDPFKRLKHPAYSDKAIRRRDKLDVKSSDVVFVNFMEATRTSIGTCMEIAWAEDWDKLVVIAMPEDDGGLHDHAFVRDSAVIFHNLEDALEYVLWSGGCEVPEDA